MIEENPEAKAVKLTHKQYEEYLPFILYKYQCRCNMCFKSINQLINEDNQLRKIKNMPPRKRPIVVLEHIDNTYPYPDSREGEYGGNLQLSCYSCNQIKRYLQVDNIPLIDQITQEKRDHLKNRPKFINWLTDEIRKHNQVCLGNALSAGGKSAGGSSEITLKRYLKTEIFTELNPKGKFELFDYQCNSTLCIGDHICFQGKKPKEVTDADAYQKELDEIKKKF
jgi:hypothetical protein